VIRNKDSYRIQSNKLWLRRHRYPRLQQHLGLVPTSSLSNRQAQSDKSKMQATCCCCVRKLHICCCRSRYTTCRRKSNAFNFFPLVANNAAIKSRSTCCFQHAASTRCFNMRLVWMGLNSPCAYESPRRTVGPLKQRSHHSSLN